MVRNILYGKAPFRHLFRLKFVNVYVELPCDYRPATFIEVDRGHFGEILIWTGCLHVIIEKPD